MLRLGYDASRVFCNLGTSEMVCWKLHLEDNTAQCDDDGELERKMHKRYETTVVPYLKHLKMQHGFFEDIGGAYHKIMVSLIQPLMENAES